MEKCRGYLLSGLKISPTKTINSDTDLSLGKKKFVKTKFNEYYFQQAASSATSDFSENQGKRGVWETWEQVSSRTAERFAPTFPTRPFSPSAFTSPSTFPKTSYPLPQHLRIRSMPQRLMPGNPSLLHQPLQTRIHRNHISPG